MTFRSNTDEVLETLNCDNKTRYRKASMYYGRKGAQNIVKEIKQY